MSDEPNKVKWQACDARRADFEFRRPGEVYNSRFDSEDERVWTVGPGKGPHWETDSGYPGYGMTKAEAELAAKAVNIYLGFDE